jgi:crotonobetainyl-CoA:carnitine CoA-transferase CaiB-like acyl-CoA transferase
VQTREEWAASETVKAGGMLVRLPHRALGEVVLPGPAVELGDSPGGATRLFDRTGCVDPTSIWPEHHSDGEPPDLGQHPGLPLAGLRVLDTSSFIAGPFTSTVLENFGATVVKVEQSSGDPFGQVASATYAALNRGKSRVVLDLKSPADLQRFYGLARECDVMIENMSLGRAEKLGIGIDDLAKDNPGIVVCSVRAWGAGPLKDTPGFDPVLQARSGLMAAQGGDGEPVVLAVPVTDIGTGTLAALGALAALYAREALGRGQHVEASLARTSLAFQAAELTTYGGRARPLVGHPAFLGESAHHRLYGCSDGWIAIRATEQGLETFLAHDGVASPGDAADLEPALGRLTVDEALRILAEAGIVAVPVLDRHHLFSDPLLLENDFFLPVDDAALGPVTAVRSFADWDGVPQVPSARTHALGEDTVALVENGWPARGA